MIKLLSNQSFISLYTKNFRNSRSPLRTQLRSPIYTDLACSHQKTTLYNHTHTLSLLLIINSHPPNIKKRKAAL